MANILVNAPKSVKKGEAFEVKTLISHVMETGFRAGTNGPLHPAQHRRGIHRDL